MKPEDVTRIVIHCTATPEGRAVTIEDVRRWHVDERGWSDVGYHWLVELDGELKQGRKEHVSGAHAKGWNHCSIGVCYVGGCNKDMKAKDTRTDDQKITLGCLLQDLRCRYPKAKIIGHRDISSKACPSFDALKEYASI
jgi:N-acetylmuramoyl-L-alanine amidase